MKGAGNGSIIMYSQSVAPLSLLRARAPFMIQEENPLPTSIILPPTLFLRDTVVQKNLPIFPLPRKCQN